MSLQLDLVKKTELVLEKKGFSKDIEAKVCIILDESGSMTGDFKNGTVSSIVDRALAIGYKFDDDGEIDVWSFSGSGNFIRRPSATQDQYGSYLKHRMLGGSTVYHQVLRAVAKDYYERTQDVKEEVVKKAGFFSRLMGGSDQVKKVVTVKEETDLPAFVIFITDGRPDVPSEALKNIKDILTKYPKMFVQFIGVGYSDFSVLKDISEKNDNAAFNTINSNDSDEVVLDKFLNSKARKVLED